MKNEDDPKNTVVYCVQCPKNGRIGENRNKCPKDEIEQSQWDSWTCTSCRAENNAITLEVYRYIKNRIAVTKTEDEDQSKFIFREILQNADDVKSNILVLRFEEDALYVANDGRAFTTTSPTPDELSDFDRMSQILGGHQEEDKETVGHFGSGFQTVYAITNGPEVHSSGLSGQMNPIIQKWNLSIDKLKSPYIHKEKKGVLFRFPWRDDQKAEEEFNGKFKDFPRWNKEKQRNFFEDLKDYIHQAILCCQYLNTIRLIWQEEEGIIGFQVTRDFTLRLEDSDSKDVNKHLGTIKQGFIEPDGWTDEWNKSFQIEAWKWKDSPQFYQYLIGSANVVDFLHYRVYFGRKADGSVIYTTQREKLVNELKRGDFHLLFPLFDVLEVFPNAEGRAFLYSVIPLPRRSMNKFSFSAHFFPTEDRKDVDVQSNEGENKKWYRNLMENVATLYRNLFSDFLKIVYSLKIDEGRKQRIILNSIPTEDVQHWMRPGQEIGATWAKRTSGFTLGRLLSSHILLSDGQWIKPNEAYWANDAKQEAVVRILGEKTFTTEFVNHPHFRFLEDELKSRKVSLQIFNSLWSKFEQSNQNEDGFLVYNQKLTTGEILDRAAIYTLIDYCIIRHEAWEQTMDKQVVPGKDGNLRQLSEYPLLPENLVFMNELFPESYSIHENFKTEELEEKRKKMGELTFDDIIRLINNTIEENPIEYENMDENHHRLIARALNILIQEPNFALTDAMKDQKFIPYRIGNKISVGTPNVRESSGGIQLIQGRVGEIYQRHSIFAKHQIDVPGLTKELEEKIKFLDMLDFDDKNVSEVEKKLSLIKLIYVEKKPTNFIRHFLSPLHNSLFVDSNLEELLGIHGKESILKQKKEFQKALKVYFKKSHEEDNLTPGDMGGVPCLFDNDYQWHNAEEFAIDVYPELKLIDYRSLHEELQWPKDTLLALGVRKSPKTSKIVKAILKLLEEKEKNREDLTNILVWLLTSDFFMEFEEIKHIEWVPVVGGGFNNPEKVLPPSKENIEILGEDFEGFLDYSQCSKGIEERALGRAKEPILKKRLEEFGIKTEPEIADVFQVVKKRRRTNKAPPPQLFDFLNKTLSQEEVSSGNDGESFGYYQDGQWLDSKQVRIMDINSAPQGLDSIFIVSPENKHSQYLLFDGAKRGLIPEDVLQALILNKELEPKTMLELWDELRNKKHLINELHKEKYGESKIYPIKNLRKSPQAIICIDSSDDGSLFNECDIGPYYIVDRNMVERDLDVLEKLGARNLREFNESDIIHLLELERKEGETIDVDKVDLILKMIERLAELNPSTPFPDKRLWPAEYQGEIVWKRPRFCYLKDSLLAKHFKDDLPFLFVEIDGNQNKTLFEYARLSGCIDFSEKVQQTSSPQATHPIIHEGWTRHLKEVGKALSIKFRRINKRFSCFDWLETIEVRTCEELVTNFTIDNITKTIKSFASIVEENSQQIIHLQEGNMKKYDDLTNLILLECAHRGFPEKNPEFRELEFIVYKLLTNDPNNWKDLIDGYEFEDHEFSFIKSYIPSYYGEAEGGIGFHETKSTLQLWYGFCQICYDQTPWNEYGFETAENLKSLIGLKSTRYMGVFPKGYSPENCLLLCPRHQTLFVRKLVKFPAIECKLSHENARINETIELLKPLIEKYKKISAEQPNEFVEWPCEVFEGRLDKELGQKPKGGIKSKWEQKDVKVTAEHLTGLLKTMLRYLQGEFDTS